MNLSTLPGFGKYGRFLMSLIVILGLVLTVQAQGDADDAAPAQPGRSLDRQAPYREPKILSQEATIDGATNTVILLPAVADTYIASARPNENFGADALYLGYNLAGPNNYGAQRLLLRFDVDTFVPDGAVIHSAALSMRLSFSSPADDVPMGTVLRRLASPWSEFGATWNGEPTWTPVDSTADVGSSLTWYEWDMTELVTNWAQNVYPNDGLEIIGDETIQQRERAFYSRETTTDFYPRLIIDYTDTGDTMPPIVTVDALPAYSKRNFTVSWSGSDQGSAGIAHYDVQVRVDGGDWADWQIDTTDTSADYVGAENGRFYEFRARGVDNVGNVEPFGGPEAGTTADTMPPVTVVDPLPAIVHTDSITVSWSGSDDVTGIQYYDVNIRMGNGDWNRWLPLTTATSFTATGLADGWYQFEARAVDNLNHVEPFLNQAEAGVVIDADPPFVEPAIWLPVIAR